MHADPPRVARSYIVASQNMHVVFVPLATSILQYRLKNGFLSLPFTAAITSNSYCSINRTLLLLTNCSHLSDCCVVVGIGWEGVNRMYLAQDRDQRRDFRLSPVANEICALLGFMQRRLVVTDVSGQPVGPRHS